MHRIKKTALPFLAVFLAAGAGFYVHSTYLFNPLTFKKDNVTVFDWNHYPSALEMDIANIDAGWETVRITERSKAGWISTCTSTMVRSLLSASRCGSG